MLPRLRASFPCLLLLPLALTTPSWAQSPDGSQQGRYGNFHLDLLGREEWTRSIPQQNGTTRNESRWSIQGRPRYELAFGPFELGVGAAINYSQDRNDEPPSGGTLDIVRDNYRSRDLRLDLAYARLRLGPLSAQGGRFAMPLALTQMIWDRELRPQGGAASLSLGGGRFQATALYATGSHVFEDASVMYGGGAQLTLASGTNRALQIVGSYLQFEDLEELDPVLRRQNSTLGGDYVREYRVADAVFRLTTNGPMTLVADYCWNTALSSENRGLWISASFGALQVTPAQVDYTYARIDRDATVAAFNGDDFYWGTGWEGHRFEIGRATTKNSSVHAIAQWQRPKDEAAAEGDWVLRWRLEWRSSF